MRVVLEEDRDGGAEVGEAQRADVVPREQDLARAGVVQAHGELEDRGFSRAVGADDDAEVAGGEDEGDVVEGEVV